jgi:hypothetical protein
VTPSEYQSVLGDGFQPNVKYYWRVRSVNTFGGIDQFSGWSSVFYYRSVMLKPVLLSPANSATPSLLTRRPAFDWQDTAGATSYQFTISANGNMTTPLINAVTVSSDYVPVVDLPANTALFWRVRANGANGPSAWSDTWTFKTGNPPSVPVLILPLTNAIVTDYTPTLDWGNSTTPSGVTFKYYEIQIADNAGFSTPIDEFTDLADSSDSNFSDSDYPLGDLTANAKYWWRVRSVGTDNVTSAEYMSSWSVVRTFRTALPAPSGLNFTTNPDPAKPTFDWADVAGSTGYTIQISANSSFSSPLVNATTSGASASSYTPAVNLPLNKTLYWRVRANGANTSAWTTSTLTLP